MKHLLFDIDGTLVDTESAILKTWDKTLRRYNFKFTPGELRVVLGTTTRVGLQSLYIDVDENTFIDKWRHYYGLYAMEGQWFPGVEEMLKRCKASGVPLGCIASRSREEYINYFEPLGFNDYFDVSLTASDVTRTKPDPEAILTYIERTGADPADVMYIGESVIDVEFARAAGVQSGFASWTHSNLYGEMRADAIFYTPEDILRSVLGEEP